MHIAELRERFGPSLRNEIFFERSNMVHLQVAVDSFARLREILPEAVSEGSDGTCILKGVQREKKEVAVLVSLPIGENLPPFDLNSLPPPNLVEVSAVKGILANGAIRKPWVPQEQAMFMREERKGWISRNAERKAKNEQMMEAFRIRFESPP